MSSSEENSDVESDNDSVDELSDFELYESGSNAYAFEPENSEHVVAERLREFDDAETNTDVEMLTSDIENDNWCNCEKCVRMVNANERVCCQSSANIIDGKFMGEKCISSTTAFRDVCLNVNVLETALGL